MKPVWISPYQFVLHRWVIALVGLFFVGEKALWFGDLESRLFFAFWVIPSLLIMLGYWRRGAAAINFLGLFVGIYLGVVDLDISELFLAMGFKYLFLVPAGEPLCLSRKKLRRPWRMSSMAYLDLYLGVVLALVFVRLFDDIHFEFSWWLAPMTLLLINNRLMPPETMEDPPVVFFDGVCVICNGFVDFLMAEAHPTTLQLASLQGEFAKKNLPAESLQDMKSLVLLADEKVYKKSKAILKVADTLGGLWRLLSFLGYLCPQIIRDAAYDLIAKNRYQFFGQRDQCRLPSAEEKAFFQN